MNHIPKYATSLPTEQQAIRDKCFHPSGTFVEFPIEDIETSIPGRFEKIVRMYPNRLAVKAGDQALTYAELNQQANRVAHAILEQFGDKISPIIVLTDHRPKAIILCLAVLKTGKIMVPADPLFPLDRLTFMADDSKAEAILTYGNNFKVGKQLASQDRKVINASTIRSDISTDNIGLRHPPQGPSDIRYTSGSTGRPKGVVNSHRKRMFECMVYINTGHICPEDRLLVLRRLSFSPTDTLSGLLAGAALFPLDIKEHTLRSVGSLLQNEEITYVVSTPSVFRCIAQELTGPDECLHLRMINLGGEPLFRSDVELYKKHCPKNCILLNQLSGSEMGSTCQYWISKTTKIDTTIVPVGYPVEGKQAFLLDDEQKQVGVNETGEIAVASRYLSTGYWNNSELTNNKFFVNESDSVGRMYLSGDIGRMLPDGCLLYVGRKDDQVKINGAKVEIGEVEAVLSEHAQIRQSAVISFDRKSGDKYLTAYIVPLCKPTPTVTDINDHLRKRLPDYMIPSAFVFLDSLPLINGKVDRKALPKPDNKRPALGTPYSGPQNESEESLVQIWEEVLDVRPIGVNDNFFDLGGHSLLAGQVVSRIIQTLKLELPLRALFDAPTVAAMATVIIEHQAKKLDKEELHGLLAELEAISDEEAQRVVAERRAKERR
jgi:amino acid adenylation domain-containing protein